MFIHTALAVEGLVSDHRARAEPVIATHDNRSSQGCDGGRDGDSSGGL